MTLQDEHAGEPDSGDRFVLRHPAGKERASVRGGRRNSGEPDAPVERRATSKRGATL
jgi:hypothetical protein